MAVYRKAENVFSFAANNLRKQLIPVSRGSWPVIRGALRGKSRLLFRLENVFSFRMNELRGFLFAAVFRLESVFPEDLLPACDVGTPKTPPWRTE